MYNPSLLEPVLLWVYEKQELGQQVTDEMVAEEFKIPLQEAIEIHNELDNMGELEE